MTATRAVFMGHLFVNGGVVSIVALTVLIGILVFPRVPVGVIAVVGGLLGWPWWSAAVPRWWNWALSHGLDPYELQRKGEASQLLWPRDSFLAKTEFGDRWKDIDSFRTNPLLAVRDQLLSGDPAPEFGLSPAQPLWGVVSEFGLTDGSVTLVALEDGTCSIYTSSGGGVIGAGRHPEVGDAVAHLVATAQEASSSFPPANDLTFPGPGECSLFLLLAERVVGARGPESTISSDPTTAPIYDAAQGVLTAVRERRG